MMGDRGVAVGGPPFLPGWIGSSRGVGVWVGV